MAEGPVRCGSFAISLFPPSRLTPQRLGEDGPGACHQLLGCAAACLGLAARGDRGVWGVCSSPKGTASAAAETSSGRACVLQPPA